MGTAPDARPTLGTIWLEPNASVVALRSERLVRDVSGARLEVTDLLVDPRTASVREALRASIALAPLAGNASGFGAYAFRDGDAVEIVVTTHGTFQLTSARGDIDSNDCDHARIRLDTSLVGGDAVVLSGRYDERDARPTLAPSESDAPLRTWSVQMSASATRTKSDATPVLSLTLSVLELASDRPSRM